MSIPTRYSTGYLPDTGTPPPYGPMDFAAWFEAFLDGNWHTIDARNDTPRIGRVLTPPINSDRYSWRTSAVMRTARERNSAGYLATTNLLTWLHPSQEVEPPDSPGVSWPSSPSVQLPSYGHRNHIGTQPDTSSYESLAPQRPGCVCSIFFGTGMSLRTRSPGKQGDITVSRGGYFGG